MNCGKKAKYFNFEVEAEVVPMLRVVQVTVVGKVFRPNPNKVLALNRTLNEYFRLVKWYLGLNFKIEAQPTWKDLETFMQSRGKEILLR